MQSSPIPKSTAQLWGKVTSRWRSLRQVVMVSTQFGVVLISGTSVQWAEKALPLCGCPKDHYPSQAVRRSPDQPK